VKKRIIIDFTYEELLNPYILGNPALIADMEDDDLLRQNKKLSFPIKLPLF